MLRDPKHGSGVPHKGIGSWFPHIASRNPGEESLREGPGSHVWVLCLVSWILGPTFPVCQAITHIKLDVIISSSLRLLLKVWIWYRCQNRRLLSRWWKTTFYKKVHNKTQSTKKDVLVFRLLQETKNSNLFDKDLTQQNVKCHIQHEESWLGGVVIEQVNYK